MGKLHQRRSTPPAVQIHWLAKPWSGKAHCCVVRTSFPGASQLVLVNPDGPPVSASRVLCGQKLVSTGGLMEFSGRLPPLLRRCSNCERIYRSLTSASTT